MISNGVISALKEGSIKAFDCVYDYFADDIWAFCFSYTRSRETTEELVNDIFMRLWNKRHYIDAEQGIKNYLYAIARSTLHNWFKTISRNKKLQRAFFEQTLNQQEEAQPSSIDASIDYKTLKNLLSTLPPRRRAIYERCKLDGMSYSELASYFSITRDAVKDHIVKANKVVLNFNKAGDFFILTLFVVQYIYQA